jgi:tetratricopeptide (TPR) repeat protein
VLTPGQLAERLMERFRLLSGGAAHPERHRTLRTVLESSWEQLSTQQQRTLAQLSVFRGGCSLEGAAFVVFPDEDELAALDQLTALVNHSLVFAENGRFRLLETVRLFAQARLTQSESEAAHTRLLQWLNTLASRNTEDSQGHLWLSQMEAERANLRVAVDFVREHPEHRELFFSGLDLVMATDPLYRLHGGIAESQRELLYFLEHLPNTHSEFGRAHWVAGRLAFLQADFVASRAHYDQAEKHSSEWGRIHVLISRGILRREQGELAQAKADFMESKQICQARGGDPAWANDGLASVAWLMGEYEEARQLMGGVIAQNRQENSHIALASNLLWWAKIVRDQGHFEEETAALYEALSLSQELGYTQSAAGALCGQAECYLRVGDTSVALGLLTEAHELLKKAPHVVQNARLQLVQVMALRQSGQLTEAEKNLREVLSCFLKAGIPDGLILGLIEAGSLRQAQGEEEQAAHFFGAADTLRLRYGFVLPPSRQTQFVTSSHSLTHQEALARIALL